jgi:hypothetical protein
MPPVAGTSRSGNVSPGGVRVPGGPPGLQNRCAALCVAGGFDSRPPPPQPTILPAEQPSPLAYSQVSYLRPVWNLAGRPTGGFRFEGSYTLRARLDRGSAQWRRLGQGRRAILDGLLRGETAVALPRPRDDPEDDGQMKGSLLSFDTLITAAAREGESTGMASRAGWLMLAAEVHGQFPSACGHIPGLRSTATAADR